MNIVHLRRYTMVHKKFLLLIAGIIWFIAGFNIFRIGITADISVWRWWMILISITVLLLFHFLIFRKMVKKHTRRIIAYQEIRQPLYRFFNRQAYCIMAFMMTFGIGLRLSGFVPDLFIGVFYTGLGTALLIAGLNFIVQFTKYPQLVLQEGDALL